MKKNIRIFMCAVMLLISGFLFNGCSCSPAYMVNVTFIEAPEEIKVVSYSKDVGFEGSHTVEFEIPEGYEESDMVVTIDNEEIDFDVEYIKGHNVDENYLYSVKKKISFGVADVRRSIDIKIDMTNLHKKTFDVKFTSGDAKDFEIVIINPESISRLLTLNSNNTVKKIPFFENKAQVSYGDYIALVYKRKTNANDYTKIYSNKGYFTDPSKIKMINDQEYIDLPAAKRGNTYYIYGGDTATRIFYFGVVKENVDLSFSLPSRTADNRLKVGEGRNTFYLLTNLQKYNSDIISIQSFVKNPNASYSVNDSTVDKIDGETISKITPTESYKLMYDVHKIYLGDNITIDPFLSEEEKANLYDEIYFQIATEIGIKNLTIRLLVNEKMMNVDYTKLSVIESDKDKSYVKISKEEIIKYYSKHMYEDSSGNTFEYYNGAAILYVGIDAGYVNVQTYYETFKYSKFTLRVTLDGLSSDGYSGKYRFVPYVIDDYGNKDYGYVDYHLYSTFNSLLYLETSKIYDSNGKYKNSLYLDVYGEDYEGYTSTKLYSVDFIWGTGQNITQQAVIVSNPKVYNGVKGYHIYKHDPDSKLYLKEPNNSYTLTARIIFQDVNKSNYSVDFSALDLPQDFNEGIYVANTHTVSELSDFTLVNFLNKELDLGLYFGYSKELYYLITSRNLANYEVDMALDGLGEKMVSYDSILYDIAGNKVTIMVNGESFVVRYKYMSESYEAPDNDKYHLVDNV